MTCEDGQEITRLWRHDGLLSALAVAERVRWQLDGWRAAQDAASGPGVALTPNLPAGEGVQPGGITLLRLIPDQLVGTRAVSLACGATPWSATGWPARRSGSRPCSGTTR